MTVQNVVTATATDMRQLLSDTAPDANIIIPWVDRIQKDILHTSLFNYLLRKKVNITTIAGTSSYTFTVGSDTVRRILSVYDRTFDRIIPPYGKLSEGFGLDKALPEPMLSGLTMIQWPAYYLHEGVSDLFLFPAPQKAAFAGTVEVHYEKGAPTVTALTDTLLVPDDATDLIVAGVNSLAAAYLKNYEESTAWKATYEAMKGVRE